MGLNVILSVYSNLLKKHVQSFLIPLGSQFSIIDSLTTTQLCMTLQVYLIHRTPQYSYRRRTCISINNTNSKVQ